MICCRHPESGTLLFLCGFVKVWVDLSQCNKDLIFMFFRDLPDTRFFSYISQNTNTRKKTTFSSTEKYTVICFEYQRFVQFSWTLCGGVIDTKSPIW